MDAAVWNGIWPDWQFKNVIGRGAYGVVYRAVRFFEGKEEESAIKVISLPHDEIEIDQLRSEGMTEEETQNYYASLANEFYEEILTMKALNGSVSIVNVQDSAIVPRKGEFGWNILIRMECLTPLAEYLNGRTLTEAEVTALGIDLCHALEVCEEHGILHRDIKPENIFVDKEGHFKLGDFGIAKQLESTTGAYTRVGTPFYSAPEVAEGLRYDRRADIYSLGLVLYRLLNGGRLPFMPEKRLMTPSDRRNALERRLQGEALPAPEEASEELAQIVLKACAPKAKDRYGNAAEFREALENTHKTAVLPWWKRRGVRIAGVVLAALLTGGTVYGIASGSMQGNVPAIPVSAASSSEENAISAEDSTAADPETAEEGFASSQADKTDPEGTDERGSADSTETQDTSSVSEETMDPAGSSEAESTGVPASSESETAHSETGASDRPASPSASQPGATEAPETQPAETTSAKPAETKPSQTAPSSTAQESVSLSSECTHPTTTSTVTQQPTCTASGKRVYSCAVCGEKLKEESIPALGHSFGSWTTVAEATCTEAGRQQRTCSRCSAAEEQTVAALGHNMVDGVCTRCGEGMYQFVINADGKTYTLVNVKAGLDTSKKVVLPSTYKGCPVTRIKDGLFRDYQFDGGLQLPASLNYIGESTFHSCRIAGTLTIPGSVKTIAEWAFCRANIDTIILEEGVTTLKSVSFGSLSGRPSMTVSSTVQGYDNAFAMASGGGVTHFSSLTIKSQSLLDSLGGLGGFLIDTLQLGSNVSGYSVKGGCLIRNSTATLLKACVNFTIPADGSVKIIDGGPFWTDFNGNVASTLYELRLPEGILRVLEAGYSSSIQTVFLPHSLQYIEPVFLGGGGLKNIIYSGTISEWTAICEKVPEERRDNWKYHSGLQLGCTDGVFYYDTDHWVQQ